MLYPTSPAAARRYSFAAPVVSEVIYIVSYFKPSDWWNMPARDAHIKASAAVDIFNNKPPNS
jgi:hypothetical protein